jgi:Protein of unknown function (DUF3147)
MVVKFQLSALQRTKWYEVILRIPFGGLTTVATGMIAKSYGPVVGGLFLAFPAIFPASATLVEKHEKEKKERAHIDGVNRARRVVALEARGTAMGSIGLGAFAIVVWQFLFGKTAWLVLTAATLSWLITSLLVWELRRVVRGNLLAKNRSSSAN